MAGGLFAANILGEMAACFSLWFLLVYGNGSASTLTSRTDLLATSLKVNCSTFGL